MLTYTYYYDVWLEEVVSGKKLCAPMEQEEGLESTKWKLVHCEPDVPVILTVSHPPTRPPRCHNQLPTFHLWIPFSAPFPFPSRCHHWPMSHPRPPLPITLSVSVLAWHPRLPQDGLGLDLQPCSFLPATQHSLPSNQTGLFTVPSMSVNVKGHQICNSCASDSRCFFCSHYSPTCPVRWITISPQKSILNLPSLWVSLGYSSKSSSFPLLNYILSLSCGSYLLCFENYLSVYFITHINCSSLKDSS